MTLHIQTLSHPFAFFSSRRRRSVSCCRRAVTHPPHPPIAAEAFLLPPPEAFKADKELVHATTSALHSPILPLLVSLPAPTSAKAESTSSSATRRQPRTSRQLLPEMPMPKMLRPLALVVALFFLVSLPAGAARAGGAGGRKRNVGAVPAQPGLRADVPVGPNTVRRGRAQQDGLLLDRNTLGANHL